MGGINRLLQQTVEVSMSCLESHSLPLNYLQRRSYQMKLLNAWSKVPIPDHQLDLFDQKHYEKPDNLGLVFRLHHLDHLDSELPTVIRKIMIVRK